MAGLATSLALAVLQYHSTPWLPQDWRSSQVAFFGVGQLSGKGKVTIGKLEPYLNVELANPDRKGKGKLVAPRRKFPTSSAPSSTVASLSSALNAVTVQDTSLQNTRSTTGIESETQARSELLFRFGIILLELAYGRPWSQLIERAMPQQPRHLQTEFHAAKTLSETNDIKNRLGPLFQDVVQTCIGCRASSHDFLNVDDEEWQNKFLADVVTALQRTEAALQKLDAMF
jgi:hypothetical protein